MVRTYQHVFAQVAINDVRGVGNRIVIATAETDALAKKRILKRAAAITTRGKFPFDLKEIVEEGVPPTQQTGR